MAFGVMNILIVLCIFLSKINGENIVDELMQRFNDVSNECVDAQNQTQPAYKCTGIIIRGIRFYNNETKFAWSLKPSDKEKNAFSMGYLRNDHPFSLLGKGYDAGFIIYPHLKTPRQKTTQKVLCVFPFDGWTDWRGDRGCGQRKGDSTGLSRQCDTQNITSFPEWLSYFKKLTKGNSSEHHFAITQCGFDLTKETQVTNFEVALEANTHLQKTTRNAFINSELRVEGWDENNTKAMPIETFFYFIDSERGYQNAVKFRDDFKTQSGGENVPIVGIRLPSRSNPNIYMKEGK